MFFFCLLACAYNQRGHIDKMLKVNGSQIFLSSIVTNKTGLSLSDGLTIQFKKKAHKALVYNFFSSS